MTCRGSDGDCQTLRLSKLVLFPNMFISEGYESTQDLSRV